MGLGDVKLRLVDSLEEANAFLRWLGERRPILAVDTETEGLRFWKDRLRLLQFGDLGTGWAIPFEMGGWGALGIEALRRYEGDLVLHNATFDAHMIRRWGGIELDRSRVHDTLIMSHLLDPPAYHGLKPQAAEHVDPKAAYASKALDAAMATQGWDWSTVPIDYPLYWSYGCLDTVLTAHLHEALQPRISERFRDIYDMEREVMWITSDMRWRGAPVDLSYCSDRLDRLHDHIATLEKWCQTNYGIYPGSNQKVAERLISDGIALTERTPTGEYQLDKAVLVACFDHPLAKAVLDRRQAQKVCSAYLSNFEEMADNGRLHASINPLGARTGRMSVTEPALQTLPRNHSDNPYSLAVRGCFISGGDDQVLLTIDADQIEMRLLAHFSRDEAMIEGIRRGDELAAQGRKGYDLHSMNTRAVFGIHEEDPVPKELRDRMKNAGFAKCLAPGTRILRGDFRWVPIEKLQAGDEVIGFDEWPTPLHPISQVAQRRWKTTPVLGTETQVLDCYRLVFDDDTEVVASGDHRWLNNGGHWVTTKGCHPNGRTKIGLPLEVWDTPDWYEVGWLAGLVDGEGHLNQKVPNGKATYQLGWAQNPGNVLDQSIKIADALGFDFRLSPGTHSNVVRVALRGGMAELMRFIGTVQPLRLRLDFSVCPCRMESSRYRSVIKKIGPFRHEVVAVTTGSRTYMAEGMPSHNCYGAGLEKFSGTAGIPLEVGQQFLDAYDQTFPGVRALQREVDQVVAQRQAREGVGYVNTPAGRYQPVDPGHEYAAINYLIQGFASDLLKRALVNLERSGLGEYMLLPVHDEVVFSVPKTRFAEIRDEAVKAMTDEDGLLVPITWAADGPFDRWSEKYQDA